MKPHIRFEPYPESDEYCPDCLKLKQEKKRREEEKKEEEDFQLYYTGETPIEFGKHKGKTLPDIVSKDTRWACWAVENMTDRENPVMFALKKLLDEHQKKIQEIQKEEKRNYEIDQLKKKHEKEEEIKRYYAGEIPIGFGRHREKTLRDIVLLDPGWTSWAIQNVTSHSSQMAALKKLLDENKSNRSESSPLSNSNSIKFW